MFFSRHRVLNFHKYMLICRAPDNKNHAGEKKKKSEAIFQQKLEASTVCLVCLQIKQDMEIMCQETHDGDTSRRDQTDS